MHRLACPSNHLSYYPATLPHDAHSTTDRPPAVGPSVVMMSSALEGQAGAGGLRPDQGEGEATQYTQLRTEMAAEM